MEQKKYLISQLKRLRRIEFFSNLPRLILVFLFVVLSPILIYDKILRHEYFIVVILIIAEIVFFVLAVTLFKHGKEKYSLRNSRIIRCIDEPELVSKILITSNKILFEIKGLEDEAIVLKHSEYRKKIINSIKSVFDSTKIVSNV